MIIDSILDRKFGVPYDPAKFYHGIMRYVGGCGSAWACDITAAMDGGTETDVKSALCRYIIEADYNPEICDYIRSVEWIGGATA